MTIFPALRSRGISPPEDWAKKIYNCVLAIALCLSLIPTVAGAQSPMPESQEKTYEELGTGRMYWLGTKDLGFTFLGPKKRSHPTEGNAEMGRLMEELITAKDPDARAVISREIEALNKRTYAPAPMPGVSLDLGTTGKSNSQGFRLQITVPY